MCEPNHDRHGHWIESVWSYKRHQNEYRSLTKKNCTRRIESWIPLLPLLICLSRTMLFQRTIHRIINVERKKGTHNDCRVAFRYNSIWGEWKQLRFSACPSYNIGCCCWFLHLSPLQPSVVYLSLSYVTRSLACRHFPNAHSNIPFCDFERLRAKTAHKAHFESERQDLALKIFGRTTIQSGTRQLASCVFRFMCSVD